MAQIIEDIIATDKQAREIVQKAQARREKIMQVAAEERDRLIKEGEDKLNGLKSRLESENEAFRKSLEEKTSLQLAEKKAALYEKYTQSEDKWINDIFARLTAAQ